MKRLTILTLALILILSLAACGRITDVLEPSTNNPTSEAPTSESPTGYPEPEDSKSFIGLWHSMNMVAAGFAERYVFNEDGTFIYGTNQMDEFNRELYATGIWSIVNRELKLEVGARLVVPVGDIDEIAPSDELIILNREVVKVIYNPPEVETYSIAKTGTDPETGRTTITIDGVTFYDFNNQPDMFDDYYELINSSDNASPEE